MSLLRSSLSSARPITASLALASSSSTSYSSALRTFHSSRLTSKSDTKDPQLGDYPDLPFVSFQTRKYSPKWWDTQEKRNFGEIPHEQDDVLSVWAPDVHATPASSALRQFLLAAGVGSVLFTVIYTFKAERPSVPRTYPRDGLATELGGSHVAAPAEGAFDTEAEEDDE
ncbi:hypothetical protein IE53DRAFT_387516 [Violaceomyces palustris]|uniref:Uncharacterized protein n=1 Tax=Violaceomyces palustris TaxID=1673888 RepID=A0ACD0NWQ7_9BASI|nr:hypothetical protein IE53DRAFT_387516 [Violaceomyces palustris]